MCRFLAYKGREISMSDLLTRSDQSLIRQSFKAREREEPLNGDGFGVGWYAQEIDPTPCVFTSVQPAWANRNLHRLAEKIRSACFFAHVRAAAPGSPVNELNCHPFQYDRFLWMHNGHIGGFGQIKRELRDHLSDEFYNYIQGTTDSEHAFALFLNELHSHLDDYNLETLQRALRSTIRRIERWQAKANVTEASYLNFSLTDGENILALRYVTEPNVQPHSMYLARGKRFELQNDHYRMLGGGGRAEAIIIASEPLTEDRSDWQPVPANQLVTISPEFHVKVQDL
jgi:glutamine amidotransferase